MKKKIFIFIILAISVVILLPKTTFADTTCVDLGGTACCSNIGKTCDTSYKISGASDCTECCQSLSHCIGATACNNNEKKDPGEQCDGSDLGGATCASLGFTGGTLSCNTNCVFDTSGCTGGGGGGGGTIKIESPINATSFEAFVGGIVNFLFILPWFLLL